MIVTIVGGDGAQIYRGHEGNEKVARLIGQGNVRVDSAAPDPYATWDGAAWQPGSPPVVAPENTPTTTADIERYLRTGDPGYDASMTAIKKSRP